MTALPELTVAVSTIDDRVLDLAGERLHRVEGVQFLILIQFDRPKDRGRIEAQLAELAMRDNCNVLRLEDSRGVASSRSAAIDAVETPLLLFADDDMTFNPGGWHALRQAFADDVGTDFLCGRLCLPEGGWRKPYGPERPRRVSRFNCLRIGTPELAIRQAPVHATGVRFDPAFGAGTRLPVGDEAVFVADCLSEGLRGYHVPIALGSHPAHSSSMVFDRATLATRIPLFTRVFGLAAPLMRAAFALRNRRRIASWRTATAFVLGILYQRP